MAHARSDRRKGSIGAYATISAVSASMTAKHYARGVTLASRDRDGENIVGDVSSMKIHHRGTRATAMPNAIGFKPALAFADTSRFVAAPRRHNKHILNMSMRLEGPQYQGTTDWGAPVWGHKPHSYGPVPNPQAVVKPVVVQTATKVKRVKKVKTVPMTFAQLDALIASGAFKR